MANCIYKYKGKDYTKEEFYSLVRTTMVQPRTVQKYEKVLFPTGNTASKIEGHSTLEEFKKAKEDRIKELEKQLVPETNKIVEETMDTLNTNLEKFLSKFGFTTEQLNDLKETVGYSIIGATDFLEKIIFVQKENINKAYTKEAAYSIFNLLGRKNLLRKDLIASIHLVDNYESLKSKYVNSKLSDYKIRELIAIDYLQNKLIEAHKEALPTTNKAVSKDVTAKNKLEYTILKIKQWWSNIIRNFFKSYKRGYIEDIFNQIANDVINNNTRLFNLSKDIPYSKMELEGKNKEINDNLVKLGAINSGSYSLNRQGNLTRESINDLDYFLPYQIKDDFIKNVVKKYPQAVFSEPYSGVMGNRSLTLSLKIDDVKIDFFLPTSQEESDKNKIIIIDGIKYHHWKNIFDAKIRIGSQKHLSDLAGFTPFNREWSIYNTNWRNPLLLKDDYLNIVGQRHYNFDFIQSKYNNKKYGSTEQVVQSDNIKTYWNKNLEQTALDYFKDNNIDFEKSTQYQDLLSYFNNKKDKAITAYYLTYSENFKKYYGNINSRQNTPAFIINSIKGKYSKPSVLLDENQEPIIFYHGSGTTFDKFSKDYFLSGEGAMAYGAGFYATNYKPTADNYRDTAKAAIITYQKLLDAQNTELLELLSTIKEDINEATIFSFLTSHGLEDTEISKAKTRLLELLGLTETKGLYISLTNPIYWSEKMSLENIELIKKEFKINLQSSLGGNIYREVQRTLKISDKEVSARLYQIGIDGIIRTVYGGMTAGGFSHTKGENHVVFFEPVQAKAVNNSGLFSLENENMYDPIEVKENNKSQIILTNEQKENNNKINNEIAQLKQELEQVEREGFGALKPIYNFYENVVANILNKTYGKDNVKVITDEYGNQWREITINQARDLANILLQKNKAGRIIGQANIKAMTVLVDAVNKKADTIPHEYAHHYIAWFRDTPIVQEGIKRFGSEEALVQAIGEQVIEQKGEAYNWWKKFTNWILSLLSDKQLLQILTDSFLNRQNLNNFTYNNVGTEQVKKFAELQERLNNKEFLEGAKNAFESSEELQNVYYEAAGFDNNLPLPVNKEIEFLLHTEKLKINLQDITLEEEGDVDLNLKNKWNTFAIKAKGKKLGYIQVKYKDDNTVSIGLSALFEGKEEVKQSIISKILDLIKNIFKSKKVEISDKKINVNAGKGVGKISYELLAVKLKREYQKDLISDTTRSDYAENLWKSFEKQGKSSVIGKTDTQHRWDYYYKFNVDNQITPQQKQEALNAYTDYIARVSLGIVKNPSSGEYNYTSKVKDIVYHGSNQKINQFEIKKEPLIHFGTKNAAKQRGSVLHPVLLNVKDLQTIKDGMWFLGTDEGGLLKELLDRNILTIEEVRSINEVKNKAIEQSRYFNEDYRMAIPEGTIAGAKKLQEILKGRNIGFNYINLSEDKGSTSYAVPSQEQIHILGSKQDVEGFKEFMSSTKNIEKATSDLNTYSTINYIDFNDFNNCK
jgi:hypothetical protein